MKVVVGIFFCMCMCECVNCTETGLEWERERVDAELKQERERMTARLELELQEQKGPLQQGLRAAGLELKQELQELIAPRLRMVQDDLTQLQPEQLPQVSMRPGSLEICPWGSLKEAQEQVGRALQALKKAQTDEEWFALLVLWKKFIASNDYFDEGDDAVLVMWEKMEAAGELIDYAGRVLAHVGRNPQNVAQLTQNLRELQELEKTESELLERRRVKAKEFEKQYKPICELEYKARNLGRETPQPVVRQLNRRPIQRTREQIQRAREQIQRTREQIQQAREQIQRECAQRLLGLEPLRQEIKLLEQECRAVQQRQQQLKIIANDT
jgi:hypothetical protein